MNTDALCEVVQYNCNVADARHAGNFTMCVYLMKMREYCRWDKGYLYTDSMTKEEVGEWVVDRECLWESLQQAPFKPIEINGQLYDPFDTDAINTQLQSRGMAYSGGVGNRCTPHFFLGRLAEQKFADECQIVITSEECARDLGSPPAMTLDNKIFIRKESIRRMLWEKLQEWQWHKIKNAASRAFSFYDFQGDLNAALDQITEVETEAIILYEQGEIKTNKLLGEQWKQMLVSISNARLEFRLRALKDFYADAVTTLPALFAENREASIHFYAANMNPLRKQLCPSFLDVYQAWCEQNDWQKMQAWINKATEHWAETCRQVLLLHDRYINEAEIEKYLETRQL